MDGSTVSTKKSAEPTAKRVLTKAKRKLAPTSAPSKSKSRNTMAVGAEPRATTPEAEASGTPGMKSSSWGDFPVISLSGSPVPPGGGKGTKRKREGKEEERSLQLVLKRVDTPTTSAVNTPAKKPRQDPTQVPHLRRAG